MKKFKDLNVGDNVFMLYTEGMPGAYLIKKIKEIHREDYEDEKFTIFITEGDYEFETDETTINDSVIGDQCYGDLLVFYADVEPIIAQLNFEINRMNTAIKELEKYK